MAFSCRLCTDPAAFDALLLELAGSSVRPHVLQTSHWAALKAPVWSARHLVWEENGRPLAAATVLTRRWGRLPWPVLYVPKGPLVPPDPAVWERVLTDLERLARGGLFLKIDPDVPADTGYGQALLARLAARGWVESAEQIQFRNTLLSDLRPDDEALLAAMKPKTRYNIRLAARRGVRVRLSADFATFYALYAETAARDGFLIRPQDYYLAVMDRMQSQGLGQLFLAEFDGEAVAGLFLLCLGPTAWYFYGASADRHREVMPNHLLQWEAMRWARSRGCTIYDWWGAPNRLDENDPMWGVYRFKEGFGGRFTPWIGAWDFAPRPVLYRLYHAIMPRVLDVMRRRHRPAAGGF